MRRTLIALLIVAAAAGCLLTQSAFSEGSKSDDAPRWVSPPTDAVMAADGSRDRAAHFVEIAKQYA